MSKSKHPITTEEKVDAVAHDGTFYLVWIIASVVMLIPPITPLGILSIVLLLWRLATE